MRVVHSVAGPEEELARLARPTGPWIHLLDAAPADARQLGWLLGQDGIVVRQLRGHCGRSTYGLLDEIGAALQLPGDPAEDWAGLAALLTDMAWLPGSGHVLVVTRAGLLLAAEPAGALRGLVDAVRDVARARAEEGDPIPFHLVLQDDTLGLAAVRARLDAAGARYAELSGWGAEEPSAAAPPSARSSLTGGPVDAVDLAAGAAASTVDGVRSLGRAWEEFRGGSAGAVRVYVPVLAGPVDLPAVVGALAGTVAGAGWACLVVPVPAEEALADPRQRAVAAAATEVWPNPVRPDAEPEVAEPTAGPPTAAPDLVTTTPPAPPTTAPQTANRPDSPAPAAPQSAPRSVSRSAVPGSGAPGSGRVPVAQSPPTVEIPAQRPEPAAPEGPRDRPGAAFELIAANLQWPFDTGSEEHDAVDTALLAHARRSARTAALFRTWVQDPAGGWVRVVLGYVNRGSIADVESERTALVDALQGSGAARCCVEVLAASDVSEAHRWLEARCRPLWAAPASSPEPVLRPADAMSTPGPPADDPLQDPASIPGWEPEPVALPADATFTPGPPADNPLHDPAPIPGRKRASEPVALPADATFTPGPARDDPVHGPALAALIDWAADRPGVVGLVTAYAGEQLVVGAALDGETDPDRVRAEAPGPVEPFAPARGLDPVHLRLTRSSTRIWTRRTERVPPEPAKPGAGALDRPPLPTVTTQGPPPVRDTEEARGDTVLDGFTLVGIDRETAVGKGEPQPDDQDTALAGWAKAKPGAIALLRGVTEEQLKVYCLAVAETVDPEGARRDLARAAAAAGLSRAALEAFVPAGTISAFHLDLAVGSTRLWPRT